MIKFYRVLKLNDLQSSAKDLMAHSRVWHDVWQLKAFAAC